MAVEFDLRYEELADGFARFSAVRPDGNAVHMYVAGCKGSAMLIDAGWPGVGPAAIEAFQKAGWAADDFQYIVITHEHWDHYGALTDLRTWAQDANVVSHIYCGWVLSQRWSRFIDPGWQRTGGWQYGPPSGENFARFQGTQPAAVKIDQIVWNDGVLEVGGQTWRVWHVPGHCQGHILLVSRVGQDCGCR